MSKEQITGREREQDAAEAWLAENDPEYGERKKNGQTSATDALARSRSRHVSLTEVKEITPGKRDGNYIKRPKGAGAKRFHSMENETAIESDVDKD
ncbi:MAG: hypothetical protein IH831_03700 [Planctomycetes bacterium]|nr:hypothetical protein [Planctomycetota bacterium]